MSQIPIGWLTNRGACGCPFVQRVGWWGRWYTSHRPLYLFLPKGHTSGDQTWQWKIPELNVGLIEKSLINDQFSIAAVDYWRIDDRNGIRLKNPGLGASLSKNPCEETADISWWKNRRTGHVEKIHRVSNFEAYRSTCVVHCEILVQVPSVYET